MVEGSAIFLRMIEKPPFFSMLLLLFVVFVAELCCKKDKFVFVFDNFLRGLNLVTINLRVRSGTLNFLICQN